MIVQYGEGMVATAALWPVLVQAPGAALAWIAAIVLLLSGRGEEKRGWDAASLAAVGTGIVLLGIGLGPMAFGAIGFGAPACEACGPPAIEAFAPVVAGEVLLVLVGLGGASLAAGALALKRWSVPVGPILGIVLLAAAGVLESAGIAHTITLAWVGRLPVLQNEGPTWVHVGRTWTPAITASPGRFVLERQEPWTPASPGARAVELSAAAPGVRATRIVEVRAGEERGSLLFPIREGNTWMYVPFESRGASPRVLFSGGKVSWKQDDARTTVVRVGGSRDAGPLRAWVVTVTDPAKTTSERLVAAFDGEIHLVGPGGEDKGPFITWTGTDERDPVVDAVAGCQFALWDGLPCRCAVGPGGPLARPPGPTECAQREGDSVGWTLFRVFTVAMTVGIADPGSDAHAQGVTLSSFEPGNGPGIEPQPALQVDHDLEQLVERLRRETWDEDRLAVARRWLGDRKVSAETAGIVLDQFDFHGQLDAFRLLKGHLEHPDDAARLIKRMPMLSEEERADLLK